MKIHLIVTPLFYFQEYNFSKENPLTNVDNPLDEGQKRLAAGDLPSAVLCFEVAAQQEPENPLAWQLLGTTQAENEQVLQIFTFNYVTEFYQD